MLCADFFSKERLWVGVRQNDLGIVGSFSLRGLMRQGEKMEKEVKEHSNRSQLRCGVRGCVQARIGGDQIGVALVWCSQLLCRRRRREDDGDGSVAVKRRKKVIMKLDLL